VPTDGKYCLGVESEGGEGRKLSYFVVDFSENLLLFLQGKASADYTEHERKRLWLFAC